MRGFFGFPLEENFAAELELFTAGWSKATRREDLHLTIKFLGEFSQDSFARILPELCALGAPPARELRAGRIAAWPGVTVLECEAPPALARWHARVNGLLERKGFMKERHPVYRPHITLARGPFPPENAEAWCGRAISLRAPALYQSQAEETGRKHREILSPLFANSNSP